MPIHLTTLNRPLFLQAAGASILLYGHNVPASEAGDVDADLVYLLNDTHIGEKHPEDSAVATHLRQVITELVNRPTKPACVLINGDLALKDGQPGDYRYSLTTHTTDAEHPWNGESKTLAWRSA